MSRPASYRAVPGTCLDVPCRRLFGADDTLAYACALDWQTGETLATFYPANRSGALVERLTLAPDQQTLAVAFNDNQINLYPVDGLSSPRALACELPNPIGQRITALAFSADSRFLAVAFESTRSVPEPPAAEVWWADGEPFYAVILKKVDRSIRYLIPDNDGDLVLLSENALQHYHLDADAYISELTFPKQEILCATSYPLVGLLAMGTAKSAFLFHLWDGERTLDLLRYQSPNGVSVPSLAFSRGGTRLALALETGAVRVLSTRHEAQEVAMVGSIEGLTQLQFGPDGRRIYGISHDCRVSSLEVP